MRRLLNDPLDYLSGLVRAAVQGWDRFFFAPTDPTPLGVIRVGVGLLLFWSLLVTGLDLPGFLGSHAWADPAAVHAYYAEHAPWAWSFWLGVPDAWLRPVWAGCLVILALYTAGLGSRYLAPLAWVIAVSTSRRSPVMLYGFDQILTTWAFYLAVCGASGRAVSLDRFLSRLRTARAESARRPKDGPWRLPTGVPEPSVAANIGLRLIQLHLILIYGMAGLAKLRGEAWWNGNALWGVVAAGEFRRFDLTWLASYPGLLNLMTHVGLAFELAYPILIWNRRLRPLVIVVAVGMHGLIDLTLGLTEFGLAMVVGNLAFVSGPWLRSLVTGEDAAPLRVLYDGACPKCRATMAVCTAADPARLVEPVDLTAVDVATVYPSLTREACLRSMHAVSPQGRVWEGFDAVLALARRLPLGWPLAMVGWLPGVVHLGRRGYRYVAETRRREGPCTDETCGLHAHVASPRDALQTGRDAR